MKKFATSLLFILLAVTLAFSAAGDKRMTIEDTLAIKGGSAPQFSPDGKWIGYTVSEWDKENDRRLSHIHLVSTDGGRPINLTNGQKVEQSQQWSPDGT